MRPLDDLLKKSAREHSRLCPRQILGVQMGLCSEEIMNEREVRQNGLTLCRACSGSSYYQTAGDRVVLPVLMDGNHGASK